MGEQKQKVDENFTSKKKNFHKTRSYFELDHILIILIIKLDHILKKSIKQMLLLEKNEVFEKRNSGQKRTLRRSRI